MKIKDLFSSVDCIVITTKFSEKSINFEKYRDLFKSLSIEYAVPIDQKLKMAKTFVDHGIELKERIKGTDEEKFFPKHVLNYTKDKLNTERQIHKHACTESLCQTEYRILEKISNGSDNVLLLEDDAFLRQDLFEKNLEVPENFDVLILGGNRSDNTDSRIYATKDPEIIELTKPRSGDYGTHATIYSPNGAKGVLKSMKDHHTHIDYARKPYLYCEESSCYQMFPDLFTTIGESSRVNNVSNTNPISREEAQLFKDLTRKSHKKKVIEERTC